MSCRKCIAHAQKKPLVSYIDFAKTNPKIPAIVTPIIPLGIPAKCGIPNNTAEMRKIVVGARCPLNGDTIPNLKIISSPNEFVSENKTIQKNPLCKLVQFGLDCLS